MSSVVPLYLKKEYSKDPIFTGSKIVTSFYGDTPKETFSDQMTKSILFGGIKPKDVEILDKPDGIKLAELAALYSDGVIMGSGDVDPQIIKFCEDNNLQILPFNEESMKSKQYIDEYSDFYDKL